MMMVWCSKDLQWWHALLWWMTEDLQWFDASLGINEVMRTCNGGMPHSLLGGGEVGLSPATSPSWAAVWDHFHFPLVALVVPLR